MPTNGSPGILKNSRVAFLQNNAINESLGLVDLAGHLRDLGVGTRLFLGMEERNLGDKLRAFDPFMAVIPCDLLGHNSALGLARLAKASCRAWVVLGGTHPTFYPNVVQCEGVDYAFAGEAEGVVTDLLRSLIEGSDPSTIPNLIVRENGGQRINHFRPLETDLDSMALPDRETYYRFPFIARFPWKKFGTGRGCLNSCGYCFNPTYRSVLGTPKCFLRRKSPGRIAEEINLVRRKYPLKVVHFSDDMFNSGEEWLDPFIEKYRASVNVPFSCNVYAKSITERSIELLGLGGCRTLAIGVETADDRLRNGVLNKGVTTEDLIRAARLVRRAGIRLVTFNIIGMPWADSGADIETLELNKKMGTRHARVSVLVPFPKSAVTRRMMEEGRLSRDLDEHIYEVKDLPRWPAEDMYKLEDPVRTMRLLRIWHLLLTLRVPRGAARRLIDSRWSSLLSVPSFILSMVNEKRAFGLSWIAGFKYFLHVKSPALKTSNYVSFI